MVLLEMTHSVVTGNKKTRTPSLHKCFNTLSSCAHVEKTDGVKSEFKDH